MALHLDNKFVRLISNRVRNFKQKKDNLYQMSCPFCGDSRKNLTKARGFAYQKGNDLLYKCFNCGVGTNVAGLIKHLDESLFKEYTLEKYKSGQVNNLKVSNTALQITAPKFDKVDTQKTFEHAEWCDKLPEGHFCLDYLKHRQIPKKLYTKLLFTSHYKQFIDALVLAHGKQLYDDARLIIPFYNEYNELIAVSGRALETSDKTIRYVTIRTNNDQNKLVYGMDRVDLSKTVYLVEGPIDSLFLDNCLASGDANLAITAKSINAKEIVLIFDREPRNKEILKLMQKAIKDNFSIVIWPDNISGKDINEMILSGMSQSDIQNIISSNTFSGLRAQVKFNSWKKV